MDFDFAKFAALPPDEQMKVLNGTPGLLEALQLKADRQACLAHFYMFVRCGWKHAFGQQLVDNWHIAALCYHLQALWEGTLFTADGEPADVLVANLPPATAKSSVSMVLYPAWCWLRDPSAGLWFASFSQDLCDRDSMDCRRLIGSDWYQERWGQGYGIVEDMNTKRLYHNSRGGWRLAASMGARVGFGRHPRLIGIDDPHSPEMAASEVDRQAAIEYWRNKIATRGVSIGVKRFIAAQRLHEEDLSAYVLEDQVNVAHLCLPMEFESDRKCATRIRYRDLDAPKDDGTFEVRESWEDPRTKEGELLFPQLMNEKKVQTYKQNLRRAHAIAGQLQQRPTAPDGDMFLAGWFEVVDKLPDGAYSAARAWDLASATGRRSDNTAGVLGLYDGDILYVVNAVEGKWKRKQRNERIRKIGLADLNRYGDYHIRLEREGGAGGKDAAEALAEDLSDDFRVVIDKPLGKPSGNDQTLKGWEVWADLLSRDRVRLVKGKWVQKFVESHLAAPFGKHDDLIDAASKMARGLYKRSKRGRVNRHLLLLTPEEQEQAESGRRLCPHCGGPGCNICGGSGEVVERDELQAIFDGASYRAEESVLGVRW